MRHRSCAISALARLRPIIGIDNARHELVADHILRSEGDMSDALHAFQQACGFCETGSLAERQVDLTWIAGHYHPAVLPETRQKHLHLHRGGVLRLVENDN